ncbi:MAG TPA: PAS domain-containing sensor histidine kinase, partial [Paenibacillaceae bacterium]|nr:PAS domain-containing sensor histidine kinase [Paenibacillaceae bacterium]
KPLSAMKKAADRYSLGDFSVDIKIKSNDEIGVLADTFNKMAKRLGDLIVALSREKEQISSVLSSMVDGVITLDRDGKIIVTNPPAEGMLKAWWYEQGGEGEHSTICGWAILSIFQEVVKNEQEVIADVIVQGRTFSVVMAPLYDRNQVRGAVAVMRDMTEERTVDKMRKDFVANVSHELRT